MLLKELTYILAIEKYGSISEAAKQLYISQPALSKYIRSLEETLDVKLLENIGRNVILTDAGTQYVRAASEMMAIYENMTLKLLRSDNMIHGSLRIGISFTRSPFLLPAVLARFHEIYPNVEIHLFEENSYNLEIQLAGGLIDLIITKGPITSLCKVVSHPLFVEELLLCVPDKLLPQDISPLHDGTAFPWIDLAALVDSTFVLLKPGHYTRYMADHLFSVYGLSPKKRIVTANVETALRISEAGLGIAFVPSFFVLRSQALSDDLHFFSVGKEPNHHANTEFNISHRHDAHLTQYAQTFIKIMQQYCSELFDSKDEI